MGGKKALFISGSVGLGHVGRDLEIAKALHKIEPDLKLSWLAEEPASMVLKDAGMDVLPKSTLLAHGNLRLGKNAHDYELNLARWVMRMRRDWKANAQLIAETAETGGFDLVIGDETYELLIEATANPAFKSFPFVMIYDCIGVDNVTANPTDRLAAYFINRLWAKALSSKPPVADMSLFIGEVEDVPDRPFGLMLPNRRRLAEEMANFVGYILPFSSDEYRDKTKLRKLLGYGDEPLVICCIGGTTAGKRLLDLCAQAYPLMKEQQAALRMVLVCGPLLSPASIRAPSGVEVRGYVPELYKHLAASDLVITSGGGTVTLELTALKKPFIYFPLEKHFEQQAVVAARCKRLGTGIRMAYPKTTPIMLAKTALANIGKPMNYPAVRTYGAVNAARLISKILNAA